MLCSIVGGCKGGGLLKALGGGGLKKILAKLLGSCGESGGCGGCGGCGGAGNLLSGCCARLGSLL